MATLGVVKQGDSLVVDHQIREHPEGANLIGIPVDLTTATTVHVAGFRIFDRAVTVDMQATVTNASEGRVRFALSPGDTALPGIQRLEFVVSWPNNVQRTYPIGRFGGSYETLEVAPDIMGIGSPQMTTAPTLGGTVQQGSIYVGDGETTTITENGVVVFASAGANIVVTPGVNIFSVAPNPLGTSWSVGNVPTIGQAGATFDPTLFASMEASTGDTVVVALHAPTMTYYSATGGSSSGALEVGHGVMLPVNGSVFQLFEIELSVLPTVVPDGLYRWDDQSTTWVQV